MVEFVDIQGIKICNRPFFAPNSRINALKQVERKQNGRLHIFKLLNVATYSNTEKTVPIADYLSNFKCHMTIMLKLQAFQHTDMYSHLELRFKIKGILSANLNFFTALYCNVHNFAIAMKFYGIIIILRQI